MDINDFRSLITVLGFLCFLGICAWAYSKHAKAGFDEAARLPLSDDDLPAQGGRQDQEGKANG
ncbi:CcoQ/FixQ family Cbb3-type cytochrome c oxidase assembly chaperone [Thauera mechernichensis]|uniref:CcoQ/FixQ family Cbb3-type cytochrome c oxidase assembly chaperone n=1 Tax=Thauera mechernichensis TaxID=82788 RepID=A0ABW3WGI5_9RHOO|nr:MULTISPECIES: CcoQ/FixQ family Cbb3-type cytochrome c oxidase assembly chaperone [Thauera]ENO81631.1 Cbb3-type cytochrome oxidase component [Thauera sp. 27]ENO94300.1 Cbb3-type cytochrome oxidase component [Thauera sp. 28]MDG3063149.1 CcoQ/FixQ family Cbb3-type cytochrome c oxidase assembly chaperone [Thauera mechernichensis]WBL63194.1 CcoQ/FixQ family Cbb3-type cytochrome c oxidase assembly chaperone [Thauera sp. WB-2]HAG75522.1 CcoQ/FixQ family Cbb3-type cytochrome c oxidase assembly chap